MNFQPIEQHNKAPDLEQRILVVGDSHATFWAGQNDINAPTSIFSGVDVKRLGAFTAYGLLARNSAVNVHLDRILSRQQGYGLIITCFSEVDIRVHLVAFALMRQRSLDEIVEEVADCYAQFVDAVVAKYGIPVALWGPPPSRPFEARYYDKRFPVVGTPLERNYLTARLTEALAARCLDRDKVAFFSVFERLIGIDYRTVPGALYDGCHMSNAHLPAALEELYKVLEKFGLLHLKKCLKRSWPISSTPAVTNMGAVAWWQSGQDDGGVWIRADLLSAFLVKEIRLKGCAALLSIEWEEEDKSETVYEADNSVREELSIAMKSRKPHRFITFRFAKSSSVRPQEAIEILVPNYSNTVR